MRRCRGEEGAKRTDFKVVADNGAAGGLLGVNGGLRQGGEVRNSGCKRGCTWHTDGFCTRGKQDAIV